MNKEICTQCVQAVALIALGVIIGLIVFQNTSEEGAVRPPVNDERVDNLADTRGIVTNESTEEIARGDLIQGSKNTDVVVFEYSDLQCPFCARIHPTLKSLVAEGKIAWVYRHLPLEQIHPQARVASVITECVKTHSGNDAAWEYIDEVFARQASLQSEGQFIDLAKEVSRISDRRLTACLEPGSPQQQTVDEHLDQATARGINGTPGGFLLNQRTSRTSPLQGAVPKNLLEQEIQNLL